MSDQLTVIGTVVCLIAGCAALGGVIARTKRRSPIEGVLLGLLLGPIGILIEWRNPYIQRPMVDKNSLSSLRSMMVYQETGREFDRRKNRSA